MPASPRQPDAPAAAFSVLDQVEQYTRQADEGAIGLYRDFRLTSHYQPVISLAHRRAVGFEALLRASDPRGTSVSPLTVLDGTGSEAETVLLDRLCRNLHVRNAPATQHPTWLFLNVNPLIVVRGKQYGAYFEDLLQRYAIAPERIVVEIIEADIDDEHALAEAISYYRDLGCLVAIDDFGAGRSNFERIWRLEPDIVKLDRSIIAQSTLKHSLRRMLPNLTNLIHEAGGLVLIEGVETGDEALAAMDAGADMVQGFYFGQPVARPDDQPALAGQMHMLYENYREHSETERQETRALLSQASHAVADAAQALTLPQPMPEACARLLAMPRAERCYLLDADGIQQGGNVMSTSARRQDQRYRPLEDAARASWCRRPYFQRAVDSPGQLHISRPYVSITGGNLCVTISVAIYMDDALRVFCCDFDWSDRQ